MNDTVSGPAFALGYGTNGFGDHPLDAALDVICATGYSAVALTLGHPHFDPFSDGWRDRAGELRDELDRRGLRVVVETGGRYVLDPFRKHRPNLIDEDPAPRIRFLRRAIDVADLLGAECVSLWSGVLPDGLDRDDGHRRLADAMRPVVGRALDLDVRIGVEPEPGMLVETVDDALRLRESLGDPEEVGITVDLGHCLVVESDGVAGALRRAGDLLVNVQVDDMVAEAHEHLELGSGELDLRLALATLIDLGYAGVAAVELPRHSHAAPRCARHSMAALITALEEVR